MENINTNNKRVVFKLKHWEGITLFKVIEQEGFERGCGQIYAGSNGWRVISQGNPAIFKGLKKLYLRGFSKDDDNNVSTKEDKDKNTYNTILETFKELGSQDMPEPKFRDRVLVKETDDMRWRERILVHILPEGVLGRYMCVNISEEEKFKEGERYGALVWKFMKPLKENSFKEISEDTFEVTF